MPVRAFFVSDDMDLGIRIEQFMRLNALTGIF